MKIVQTRVYTTLCVKLETKFGSQHSPFCFPVLFLVLFFSYPFFLLARFTCLDMGAPVTEGEKASCRASWFTMPVLLKHSVLGGYLTTVRPPPAHPSVPAGAPI